VVKDIAIVANYLSWQDAFSATRARWWVKSRPPKRDGEQEVQGGGLAVQVRRPGAPFDLMLLETRESSPVAVSAERPRKAVSVST
jgi:hypothetical protein